MGEVLRCIVKPERERARLIREARAIYDSIFPPAVVGGQQDEGSISQTVSGGTADYSSGLLS
jgi:hypothetical protein